MLQIFYSYKYLNVTYGLANQELCNSQIYKTLMKRTENCLEIRESREIGIFCKNLFLSRCKMNMFKLMVLRMVGEKWTRNTFICLRIMSFCVSVLVLFVDTVFNKTQL